MSKKKPATKVADTEEQPSKYGYCPKCGSGWLRKDGLTTNTGSEKQRYSCNGCAHRTTTPAKEPPASAVVMRTTLPTAKRYIVTAAQNATPIHKPTWQALQNAAKYYDAELVVIPGRYKNPTSQWSQKNKDHEWWDPAVTPYLCQGWIRLNDRLVILGDVKVQWAAKQPLVGLDSLTKDRSGIVGHGSRSLRSVATPQHKHAKVMYTTGACTVRNYTDTKRGAEGKFAHCLGAVIVEIDGDTFYVRQLNATKMGSFIDLDLEFTPDEVRLAKPALAMSMGDSHVRWINPEVVSATFTAADSLVKIINPRNQFWHDIIDFHARNWHHEDDWITQFAKWKFKKESVQSEIDEGMRFVNKHTPRNCKSFIVSSNHERGTGKWLKRADFRRDPVNAEFYVGLAKRAMESARMTAGGVAYNDPFIDYAKEAAKSNVQFLQLGESKVLMGVEYGFHGDIGPNGSRGTTKNLSRLGVKVTKGHSHTAEIDGGCYSAGKSTGPLEYEQGGPSSHTNSHVIQYANGKRCIITIINGRYCLKRPKKPISEGGVAPAPTQEGKAEDGFLAPEAE